MKHTIIDSGFSHNKLSSFFDYLPQNTLVILDDPLAINQAAQNAELNIDKLLFKTKNSGKFYLEKENAYIDPANILTGYGQVRANFSGRPQSGSGKR